MLPVTIISEAATTVDNAMAADSLAAVSSGPIAGESPIRDGQVLTAGCVQPVVDHGPRTRPPAWSPSRWQYRQSVV